MTSKGTIKLQCVSCKNRREITLAEAARISSLGPCCAVCGMPEVAVKTTVRHMDFRSKPKRQVRR